MYVNEKAKKGRQDRSLPKKDSAKTASSQTAEIGRLMWIPVFVSAALLLLILRSNAAGNIRLGQYFTLAELTNTNSGLPNYPGPTEVSNLQYLVETVLDPLRREVGPLLVTSGFRSSAVNAATPGASNSSQHMRGEAADVVPTSTSQSEAVAVLRTLPVDQVITYDDSSHIHISARRGDNRGEFLTSIGGNYQWMG